MSGLLNHHKRYEDPCCTGRLESEVGRSLGEIQAPVLSEAAIRNELLSQLWHQGQPHNVLLLEEVGLLRGAYRADVVAIDTQISGYEIKSAADTLERLPHQVTAYSAVFDRASLVVTTSHLKLALEIVPEWWGLQLATERNDQTVLIELRSAEINPSPETTALARLLWRQEVDRILAEIGEDSVGGRNSACDALASTMSWDELRNQVTRVLRLREGWLPAYTPVSCGD